MFPPWEKLSEEETEEESRAGEGKGDGLRILEVVPQTTSGQEQEVAAGGSLHVSGVLLLLYSRQVILALGGLG